MRVFFVLFADRLTHKTIELDVDTACTASDASDSAVQTYTAFITLTHTLGKYWPQQQQQQQHDCNIWILRMPTAFSICLSIFQLLIVFKVQSEYYDRRQLEMSLVIVLWHGISCKGWCTRHYVVAAIVCGVWIVDVLCVSLCFVWSVGMMHSLLIHRHRFLVLQPRWLSEGKRKCQHVVQCGNRMQLTRCHHSSLKHLTSQVFLINVATKICFVFQQQLRRHKMLLMARSFVVRQKGWRSCPG